MPTGCTCATAAHAACTGCLHIDSPLATHGKASDVRCCTAARHPGRVSKYKIYDHLTDSPTARPCRPSGQCCNAQGVAEVMLLFVQTQIRWLSPQWARTSAGRPQAMSPCPFHCINFTMSRSIAISQLKLCTLPMTRQPIIVFLVCHAYFEALGRVYFAGASIN